MSEQFAKRLSAAIDASGLTLDRIQARLRATGVQVSVAALSYWRTGRSRPERARSLEAVRRLEDILGVTRGGLTGVLGRPRPRGRSARPQEAVPLGELIEGHRDAVYEGLDVAANRRLRLLSVQEAYAVASDGSERALLVRQVVRALAPVDRIVIGWKEEHDAVEVPRLQALAGVRLSKLRVAQGAGMLAAELAFPRRLDRGEATYFEYRLSRPRRTGLPAWTFDRRFTTSADQYVLAVEFHPQATPRACVEYDQPDIHTPVTLRRRIVPDESGRVQLIRLDVPPGGVGIRCEW